MKIGSVFLTVIESEYFDVREPLSVSTTLSIVVVTNAKLVSGGEIVAMKDGGEGKEVGTIVTQAAAGVNDILTVEGVSSLTEGNEYFTVYPKKAVCAERAAEKVGGVFGVNNTL